MWPFGGAPADSSAPGKTWTQTGTEDYGQTTYRFWWCRGCRKTAVTAGDKPPTACACEVKR